MLWVLQHSEEQNVCISHRKNDSSHTNDRKDKQKCIVVSSYESYN